MSLPFLRHACSVLGIHSRSVCILYILFRVYVMTSVPVLINYETCTSSITAVWAHRAPKFDSDDFLFLEKYFILSRR